MACYDCMNKYYKTNVTDDVVNECIYKMIEQQNHSKCYSNIIDNYYICTFSNIQIFRFIDIIKLNLYYGRLMHLAKLCPELWYYICKYTENINNIQHLVQCMIKYTRDHNIIYDTIADILLDTRFKSSMYKYFTMIDIERLFECFIKKEQSTNHTLFYLHVHFIGKIDYSKYIDRVICAYLNNVHNIRFDIFNLEIYGAKFTDKHVQMLNEHGIYKQTNILNIKNISSYSSLVYLINSLEINTHILPEHYLVLRYALYNCKCQNTELRNDIYNAYKCGDFRQILLTNHIPDYKCVLYACMYCTNFNYNQYAQLYNYLRMYVIDTNDINNTYRYDNYKYACIDKLTIVPNHNKQNIKKMVINEYDNIQINDDDYVKCNTKMSTYLGYKYLNSYMSIFDIIQALYEYYS